jgi:hypothetical protein
MPAAAGCRASYTVNMEAHPVTAHDRCRVALLMLVTLVGCAPAGPASAPSPPPSQDDRDGMQ